MRLDGKSARKIATGRLKTKEEQVEEAILSSLKSTRSGLGRAGKAGQRVLEANVRSVYADTLIGMVWLGRRFHYFTFEVKQATDTRPLQLLVNGCSTNTRSALSKELNVALITMHAMERLMERRGDVDIVKLAGEEFDMDFVHKMVFEIGNGKTPIDSEFSVPTPHGEARGVVGEDGVPVIRTWVKKI